MIKKSKTLFDDITKALTIERESAKFANLKHETAVDFFADHPKETLQSDSPVASVSISPVVNIRQRTAPVAVAPSEFSTAPAPPISPFEHKGNSPKVPTQSPVEPAVSEINPATFTNMDMQQLQFTAHQCTMCVLCKGRKNVVFGAGNVNADLMFIGEGPGRDEDIQGIPFVGKAGHLLTKMINAMQFQRSDVYIANIVKCRPPNNRNPEDEEAAACIPYLNRQIQLVAPKVIVLLGAVPFKYLLGKTGITKNRGKWEFYGGIKVMPTFHPAYLLRTPSAKREVWEDLKKVMQVLGKTPVTVQQR